MLKEIFLSIQKNKDDWLGIRQGKHLEDRLEEELRKNGFIPLRLKLVDKGQWQALKKEILQKGHNELIKNNFLTSTYNTYFRSPYGSQNFPDFLVFTSKFIIPIELKASKRTGSKPMWNSNLPKANCIYIFASFGKDDITFFRGIDVIEEKLSNQLWNFFIEVKKTEKKFIQDLAQSERGWKPYIRVAFEQAKSLLLPESGLDYFQHPKRKEIESKVLKWLEDKD
jgi:hypothetical protein